MCSYVRKAEQSERAVSPLPLGSLPRAPYPAHGTALLGIQGQGGPGPAYVMDLYDVSQLLGFTGQNIL